jgi:dienelactone hydrolase
MKKLFLTLTIIAATQMNAQLKPIAYADGAQKLNGFEFTPAKPLMGKPGILILPA